MVDTKISLNMDLFKEVTYAFNGISAEWDELEKLFYDLTTDATEFTSMETIISKLLENRYEVFKGLLMEEKTAISLITALMIMAYAYGKDSMSKFQGTK
jgi:hypothetical protein